MVINRTFISEYSKKYDRRLAGKNHIIEKELRSWFRDHRFLDKKTFLKLALWKSPRPKKCYEMNAEDFVRTITRFSLKTKNEEARLKSLMTLEGVSMPVASVILHYAFPRLYPILDFRVIWSLGWQQPKKYTFDFWSKYCIKITKLAKNSKCSLREIDKALWQYSKEEQK